MIDAEFGSQFVIDTEVGNQFVIDTEVPRCPDGKDTEGLQTWPHFLGTLCWGARD